MSETLTIDDLKKLIAEAPNEAWKSFYEIILVGREEVAKLNAEIRKKRKRGE